MPELCTEEVNAAMQYVVLRMTPITGPTATGILHNYRPYGVYGRGTGVNVYLSRFKDV